MNVVKTLKKERLKKRLERFLMWDSEKGYGRLTSHGYLKCDYWDHYEVFSGLDNTALLNTIRHKVCEDYAPGKRILDFGVGNGEFIKFAQGLKDVRGFDVDYKSVEWLLRNSLWTDFYSQASLEVVTFWDSLEHVPNIDEVLELCRGFVICSMPVFESREEVLESKHFKPSEHVWYFSVEGFQKFMNERGFELRMAKDLEGLCGREGIFTFVFERV